MSKRTGAAGLVLKRTKKIPAEDGTAFGPIAERFRRAGDLERAVALCEEGLKKFPDHLSARVTLGWSLLDLGRYDEARVALQQVLKRAPDNLAAIRGLAELHDRADHTMMLPMDGPGQWPPDAATLEAMDPPSEAAIAAAAAAEELAATTEFGFEFPPALAIPVPVQTTMVPGPDASAASAGEEHMAPDLAANMAVPAAAMSAAAVMTPDLGAAAGAIIYSHSHGDPFTSPEPAAIDTAVLAEPPPAYAAAAPHDIGDEFGLEPGLGDALAVSAQTAAGVEELPDADALTAIFAAEPHVLAADDIAPGEAATAVMFIGEQDAGEDSDEIAALEALIAQAQAQVQVEEPQIVAAAQITEPEIVEPFVATAQIAEPEIVEPFVAAARITEPEIVEPFVAAAQIAEPEIVEPFVAAAQITEPESIEGDTAAGETGFALVAQSIAELDAAVPDLEGIENGEAELALDSEGVELPLIAAYEAYVPEPEPVPVIPVSRTLLALNRFLRKVEARRLHVAAASMA